MRKVIISVAPVEGNKPYDNDAVAEDVIRCVEEGASICHLHSRDKNGILTEDTSNMIDLFEKICAKTDVVVQASTGGVSDMNIVERCKPLDYWRVETASLNGGSTNLGDAVYVNSFDDIKYCAQACYDREVLPEIEVFDIGMINNIKLVGEEQLMRHPIWYNLVFGHKGGIPATPDALVAFRRFVPQGQLWGATHAGREDWRFIAVALAFGATLIRVGFEDSRALDAERNAKYNWELVRELKSLIKVFGLEVATPEETRKILNLSPVLPFEKSKTDRDAIIKARNVEGALYE